jgi:26S proteasome non-ATPase regulatory subunit 10
MDGELAEISVWQLSTDGSAHLGAVLPVTERGVSLHDNSLRSVSGGAHRRAQTQSIRPETLAFLRQLDIPFVAAKSSSHAPSTRGGNSEEELEVNLNAALELLLHIIDAAKSLEDINATIPDQFEFLSGGLFRFCTEAFDAASLKLLEYLFTATADAEAGAQDLFDIVIDRIFTSRPESISSLFPDSVNNGQLTSLLHLSVARPNVREPMVLSILEKCPKLAHTVDEEGTVPLHRAAGNPACPIEVIRLLLKADPDAARRIDGEGYLPLHWAVNAEQCRPEVIKFLINACPDTCAVACNQGTIPLHWAVDRPDPSMDVVYALAKAFPKGLKRRCNAGNIPVHRCVDRSDISMECLEWLVSKYPKSLEMANNDGQLPLHRLVDRSDVDLTALSFLIEVYPGALSTPDLEGYLSIHIALDTDSPHVAAVLELVRKRPETAAMKTSDGMLPFHYALNAEEPSIELIQALLEAYPVAASRYAVDIIPEDENADPLNWTGNWKKNKWMPLDRARERGTKVVHCQCLIN